MESTFQKNTHVLDLHTWNPHRFSVQVESLDRNLGSQQGIMGWKGILAIQEGISTAIVIETSVECDALFCLMVFSLASYLLGS